MEKFWSIGQGTNAREIPFEVKRRFAWVFACSKLPRCVDNGAVIELHGDGNVFLKWSDLTFKLSSPSDIETLGEKIPSANIILPKDFIELSEGKWNFLSLDKNKNLGLSSLLAAGRDEIERVFCLESASTNLIFNPERAEKIEIIPDGINPLEKISHEETLFVEFSLSGVDDALASVKEIKGAANVKGISMLNNWDKEKELPQKAFEAIEEAGFKGTPYYGVFIGWRE